MRPGGAKLGVVSWTYMASGAESDHAHPSRSGSGDPRGGILDDRHQVRADAKGLRGMEVDVGVRLASTHMHSSAEDPAVLEMVEQAHLIQVVRDPTRAAG